MAVDLKVLFNPQLLPSAADVLFTMPADVPQAVLKNGRVRLSNTSNTALTVTLYCDAPAVASGAVNAFVPQANLGAYQSLDVDLPTMAAGWTLRGFSSTAGVVNIVETGGAIQYPSV